MAPPGGQIANNAIPILFCIISKFGHQVAPLYWKFGHQVCHLRLSYKFSHQVVPLALVRIFPPCVTTSKETSIPCQPPCHPPCLSPLSSSPYYGITNRQSYISKVLSRYLHSPGSHQLTWFLELLTDSLSNSRCFYSVS